MKDAIIIHCSATRAEQDITAADIESWHRARGFWTIGYHYVIRLDGTIEPGRDVTLDGAHCMGWNKRAIGICYVGGLDKDGRPADTRTDAQRTAWIHHWMALGLEAIEAQLARDAQTGLCCHGDTPTLADCCLVPQVFNARRFGLDLAPYPTVRRIAEHCEGLVPFQAAHPARQPDAE